MKELKFRVWDIAERIMFSDFPQAILVNPEQLSSRFMILQYTGFDDKNNQNIFEGDILEVAAGSTITVNDLAEFLIYCGRYEEKHGVPLFPSVQVVGNIYEEGTNG